jgi:CRISPR type III-A-associated RAMP protein Csm4
MKNYKIKLVPKGSMTQLPDSQKLFGALVYMFSEKYGSEKASILTRNLLEKKIHIALSNVLPWDYLPTPQEYIIDNISETSETDAKLKEKRDAIKKRSFIKYTELERVAREPKICEAVFPYVKLQNHQQPRASIESIRHGIPELESKLYSVLTVEPIEVSLNGKGEEQKRPMSIFCFYLQVDDSNICADLMDMLTEAVSVGKTLILGKRSSQGLNIFEIGDILTLDVPQVSTNKFLNLGMLLPDNIDFASSTLKLFTSERRPFEIPGGWDKDFNGYYISFIAGGSIICAPDGVSSAVKSIKSPFNDKRDIVFGNAFLYPISL